MISNDERMRLSGNIDDAGRVAERRARDGMTTVPRVLVQTYEQTSYPVSPNVFFACHPVVVSGVEAEGMSVVRTPGSDTLFVGNVGAGVPPAGTQLLAVFAPYRWIMRFG